MFNNKNTNVAKLSLSAEAKSQSISDFFSYQESRKMLKPFPHKPVFLLVFRPYFTPPLSFYVSIRFCFSDSLQLIVKPFKRLFFDHDCKLSSGLSALVKIFCPAFRNSHTLCNVSTYIVTEANPLIKAVLVPYHPLTGNFENHDSWSASKHITAKWRYFFIF